MASSGVRSVLVRSTKTPSNFGVLLGLGVIDGEVIVADRLQEAAIAGVADQRLVAFLRAAVRARPGSRRDRRHPSSPRRDCGRRCSGVRPASPPWPRSRPPCGAWSWSTARTARDRRARGRAPVCRYARAHRECRTAARASSSAIVSALIMPRSATMQTRPIANRWRSRSTTGIKLSMSAVLPGHISEQTGRPSPSSRTARII